MFHVLSARTRGRVRSRLFVALIAAWFALPVAAAQADNVVNTTFHENLLLSNPCVPADDFINLSGDTHIVITTTADASGGYRLDDHVVSHMSGVSLTTGTRYVASEHQNNRSYADPPFPATDTYTDDLHLISKGPTDNYILHETMHETVTADGTPTATVDSWRMDCAG